MLTLSVLWKQGKYTLISIPRKAVRRFVGWSPDLLAFQSSRGARLAAPASRPAALCAALLGIQNQSRIAGAKTNPKIKLVEPSLRCSWCSKFKIILLTHSVREINYPEKSSKRKSCNLSRNTVGVVDEQFDFLITRNTREMNSMWLFVHRKYFRAAKVGGSAAEIDFPRLRHSSANISKAVQRIAERAAYTCFI